MHVGYKVHCTSEPNRQLQHSVDVPSSRIQVSSYLSTRSHLHLFMLRPHVCVCVYVEDYVSDLWPFKLVNSAVNERASITFDSKLTWIVKRSNGLPPQMSFNACGHINDFRQWASFFARWRELFININLIFSFRRF